MVSFSIVKLFEGISDCYTGQQPVRTLNTNRVFSAWEHHKTSGPVRFYSHLCASFSRLKMKLSCDHKFFIIQCNDSDIIKHSFRIHHSAFNSPTSSLPSAPCPWPSAPFALCTLPFAHSTLRYSLAPGVHTEGCQYQCSLYNAA